MNKIRAFNSGELFFIVEDFLAYHFNLDSVRLNLDSRKKLEELYKLYGREVEFQKFNSVRDGT